ncbi:MAG: type II and III secretion system protein [Verrucomicrobiota bacterium]
MKRKIRILIWLVLLLSVSPKHLLVAQDATIIQAFINENIPIEVEDYNSATVKIDNKNVVIDGYWEYKDELGQVLEEPVINSQPPAVNNVLLLAARAPGVAVVSITENGQIKEYRIIVESRVKQNQTEKEIEEAVKAFIGDPGVKVRVLPPQSSIVGRNLAGAFGEEAAANLFAPDQGGGTTISLSPDGTSTGGGAGSSQEALVAASDFRPTIILEGEVANDIVKTKALNIAYAYSPNVVDLLSVKEAVQVRIRVKVLSVTHDKDQNIGLQWRGGNAESQSRAGLLPGGAPQDTGTDGLDSFTANSTNGFSWPLLSSGFTSAAPFWDVVQGNNAVETTINLLKTKQVIEVLQEPTLTVLNGQPAKVQIGENIPIVTTTVDDGVQTQSIEFVETGTILLITPILFEEDVIRPFEDGTFPTQGISQFERTRAEDVGDGRTVNTVDENGIIRLLVQPSINTFSSTFNDQPRITVQQIETRVALRENQSLVLGGLYDRTDTTNRESVPFVEKIPLVGELFKNRQDDSDKQEIIFIITPTLIGMDESSDERSILTEGNARLSELQDMILDYEENVVRKAKPTRVSASEFMVRPYEEPQGLESIELPQRPSVEEEIPEAVEATGESSQAVDLEPEDSEQSQSFSTSGSRLEIVPRDEETDGDQ